MDIQSTQERAPDRAQHQDTLVDHQPQHDWLARNHWKPDGCTQFHWTSQKSGRRQPWVWTFVYSLESSYHSTRGTSIMTFTRQTALPSPITDCCPSALIWNYAGILGSDLWWLMSLIPTSGPTSLISASWWTVETTTYWTRSCWCLPWFKLPGRWSPESRSPVAVHRPDHPWSLSCPSYWRLLPTALRLFLLL